MSKFEYNKKNFEITESLNYEKTIINLKIPFSYDFILKHSKPDFSEVNFSVDVT